MAASMMMARRLLQLPRSSVTMSMGGLRMFASKEFEEATKRVQTAQKDPGNDVKLKLYALFKQATEGPVKGSAPSAFNFVAKAKWDAWNSLGKITSDEAEKQYIALVDKIAPAGSAKAAAPAAKAAPAPAAAGSKAGIVLTSVADGVMTVTMNRPEKKNALTVDSYNQIVQALDEAKTREDVNVVVLTGAGEYFSSGNDLGNFANIPPEGPQKMAADARVLLQRFVGAFIDFPKPLIAAVNGPAIGITVTTLALCDIVYCSDNATFHTPFMSLGQSPEGCSSLLFQEIMGPSRANEMLLMGRKFLATEAKGCGFVADVFPKSDFSASVSSRAKTIAGLPIKSLTYSKALTRMTKLQALHQINDAECKRLEERWLSEDCFKAITKFMSRKG